MVRAIIEAIVAALFGALRLRRLDQERDETNAALGGAKARLDGITKAEAAEDRAKHAAETGAHNDALKQFERKD